MASPKSRKPRPLATSADDDLEAHEVDGAQAVRVARLGQLATRCARRAAGEVSRVPMPDRRRIRGRSVRSMMRLLELDLLEAGDALERAQLGQAGLDGVARAGAEEGPDDEQDAAGGQQRHEQWQSHSLDLDVDDATDGQEADEHEHAAEEQEDDAERDARDVRRSRTSAA